MNFSPVDDLALPKSGPLTFRPAALKAAAGATKSKEQAAAELAFKQLTKTGGYSAIPNCLLDLLRGVLGRNEYDVFLYILRRTLCFHKLSDAISLSQFQHGIVNRAGVRLDYGCGIKSSETIHRAVKELRRLGFIEVQTTTTHNGGHGANVYTICYEAVLEALHLGQDERQDEPEITDEATPTPPNNRGILTTANPTSSDAQTYSVERIHKNKSPNQDQKQGQPWEQPLVVATSEDSNVLVMSSQQVQVDTQLLTNFGFEHGLAVRLATQAYQIGKPPQYVSNLISYANRHASFNRHGMVRRLIERGEERSPKSARVSQSPRFSGWVDITDPDYATPSALPSDSSEEKSSVALTPIRVNSSLATDESPAASLQIMQLVEKYLANPAQLLQHYAAGNATEETVRQVLQRLGVYRRYEADFWQARRQHQINKKRSA